MLIVGVYQKANRRYPMAFSLEFRGAAIELLYTGNNQIAPVSY